MKADEDVKERVERLKQNLEAMRSNSAARAKARQRPIGDLSNKGLGPAMSLGFRVLSEFVVAILVGSAIGWALDAWLKTSPLMLIIFLALGSGAGFWSVYKLTTGSTLSQPVNKKTSVQGSDQDNIKDSDG